MSFAIPTIIRSALDDKVKAGSCYSAGVFSDSLAAGSAINISYQTGASEAFNLEFEASGNLAYRLDVLKVTTITTGTAITPQNQFVGGTAWPGGTVKIAATLATTTTLHSFVGIGTSPRHMICVPPSTKVALQLTSKVNSNICGVTTFSYRDG